MGLACYTDYRGFRSGISNNRDFTPSAAPSLRKKQQDDRRRLQPLDPNIAQRKAPMRRVVVFIRAHGLLRTIDQKMMGSDGTG